MNLVDHLHSRFLDTSLHQHWIDEAADIVLFPLFDPVIGKMTGYQHYRRTRSKERNNDPRESRYFTRNFAPISVWGTESWRLSNTLYVTEGLFDAARLTWNRQSAIAVFGHDVSPATRSWLDPVRKVRPVVVICDNDAAGQRLAQYGHRFYVTYAHDLGEATEAEVAEVIAEFTT